MPIINIDIKVVIQVIIFIEKLNLIHIAVPGRQNIHLNIQIISTFAVKMGLINS